MKEHKRILVVSFSIFTLFALLVVQFFRVQIIQEDKWLRYAKSQHELIVKEPFKRGVFFANNTLVKTAQTRKQPFVIDIPVTHLFADPSLLPQSKHQEVSMKIGEILAKGLDSQKHYLKELDHPKSRSRKLQMWLSSDERKAISLWWYPYARKHKIASNALFFVSDYKRAYPYKDLLGQVLHTIQENKEELTKQGIPTGGLEYYFNAYLSGKEGKKKLLRSPRHPLDQGEIIKEPEHGADVYLTINQHLQAICEEEVEKGVKTSEGKAGWALIMDPQTGEIWAFAQYPKFEPENYKNYYQTDEQIEATRLKGVCDCYEPGSVFKAITATICFLANEELKRRGKPAVFDPNEKVSTISGSFTGRKNKVMHDPNTYRFANLYISMRKSTNIYWARMVERIIKELGAEWYREQLTQVLGFGEKTGIEYPMESPGFIPRIGKKNPNGTLEWSTPTPFSMAIGHNLMVNSVQMARVYCAFANGGYLVKPTFVKKISKVDSEGKEKILIDHSQTNRLENFPRIFSPDVAQEIVKCLKYVVKGGSGRLADVYGYTIAGKSGTANKIVNGEYSKKFYFSSFIGIVPANKPKFVLLVSIDEPKPILKHGIGYLYWGGKSVAPVFREIARRSLKYLGVAPDNPYHYPVGDPRRDTKKIDWYQENIELDKLHQKWNQ